MDRGDGVRAVDANENDWRRSAASGLAAQRCIVIARRAPGGIGNAARRVTQAGVRFKNDARPANENGQERQARPLVVGCSTETGSDAGKVFLRASSSASSWWLRLSLSPSS